MKIDRGRSSIRTLSLLPALGLCLVSGIANAAPGTVLSEVKISETQGAFVPPLRDFDEFGGSIVHLGDLDGPGPAAAALAIGSPGADDGGSGRGAVYVVFLDALGGVLSTQKISDTAGSFTEPLENYDEFGGSLAHLGDLDGPGPRAATLAVGAPGDDDGGLNRGAVYLLHLDTSGIVLSHRKISATQGGFADTLGNGDEFGAAVAALGDLDGAGPATAAIAVGVPRDDDGGTDRGAAFVIFVDPAGAVLSHQKISSLSGGFTGALDSSDDFGGAVAALGDLDGAGPAALALAVGAVGDDDGGPARGAAYVVFLNSNGTVLAHQKISATQGGLTEPLADNDEFGGSLARLNSLGAPGTTLAVGAVGDDDGGPDRGATHLLFLSAQGTVVSTQTLSAVRGNFLGPLEEADEFGGAVTSLGNLDGAGPGAQTLVVGAVGDDDGGVDRGAIYILTLEGPPSTDVQGGPAPADGALGFAMPNPFGSRTTIAYRIEEAAAVRIDVLDLSGRRVRELVQGARAAGQHRVTWDGRGDNGDTLPAGAYFYRMTVDGTHTAVTRKVVLLP